MSNHSKAYFVTKYGSPAHKAKLVSHPDPKTRRVAAEEDPSSHDKLVNDPHELVRMVVARKTTNKAHLDKLVNDPHPDVRTRVAQHGHPDHMEKLVNDSSWGTRSLVAQHGTEEHRKVLMHDHDQDVRGEVAQYTRDHSILHHLAKDDEEYVRNQVKDRRDSLGIK